MSGGKLSKIDLIVGARPNFVKAAAIQRPGKLFPEVGLNIIHTGQHVSEMADPFVRELELKIDRTCETDGASTPVRRLALTLPQLEWFFEKMSPTGSW